MITGAPIEDAQQKVATVRRGLAFEARTADNFGPLADGGFEASRSADLTNRRIATLRFTEGFANAFKSRAATPGHIWNTHQGDALSTGESSAICPVFAPEGGVVQVVGLMDHGTCLQAAFSYVPAGVRIFVSVHELGHGGHTRLMEPESSLGEAITIGDIEARELPRGALTRVSHSVRAIWEVVTPFYAARSPCFLDFAVFASYASDQAADLPSIGTSVVAGSFYPACAAAAHYSLGHSPAGQFPEL